MVTYAPVLVEAPPVTPLPYGLLAAATVVDDPSDRFGLGTLYEADYCGEATDSAGVCEDLGTFSISVDDAGLATVNTTGAPSDGAFSVFWGDEDPDADPSSVAFIDGATHTYADPGDYTVVVTGPHSYRATVVVTVADGVASGPFDATVGVSKAETTGIQIVEGHPFAVLHLFTCQAPGTIDRGLERARRSLQLGEGRAVERVLAAQMARDAETVDLTGAGEVNAIDGIAALEQYAATHYPGVPTLHIPRGVGTVLGHNGTIGRYGPNLETVQGARVASGGGYDNLRAPNADLASPLVDNDADTAYLYVTGQVVARRGAMIDAMTTGASTNPADNVFRALAERLYVTSYECFAAAIQVSTLAKGPA